MVGCWYWFAFSSFLLHIIMACLDDMWARFSVTEEEEGSAEIPKEEEELIHRLVGRFYTKRVMNVDVVARTFKPLWRMLVNLRLEILVSIF